MKNPFAKKDNTTLIVAIVAGAITAGALAYLYITDSGAETRGRIKHKLKDGAKNLTADLISNKTGIHKKTVKKVTDHIVK